MQKRTKTQRNINGNSKTHQKEQKEQKYYLLHIILFSTKRIILHQKDYFIPKRIILHQKDYFISKDYFYGRRKTSCVQNGPFYCVW